MSFVKGLLRASGLLALLGALAFAVPAHATEVKIGCKVDGEATMFDNIKPDMGARLAGGDGHYEFTGTFTCGGVEKGVPVFLTFQARSLGKYLNIVCPTLWKWRSTDTSLIPGTFQYTLGGDPNKGEAYYAALISSVKYDVDFVGKGSFFWHNDPGGGVKPDSTTKPATVPKTGDVFFPNNDPRWKDPNPPKEFVYAGPWNVAMKTPSNKTQEVPNKIDCGKVFTVTGAVAIDR